MHGIKLEPVLCDNCGKDCTRLFLTEVNPPGGFGRPRHLMCDDCLRAAPDGSLAADVRERVLPKE